MSILSNTKEQPCFIIGTVHCAFLEVYISLIATTVWLQRLQGTSKHTRGNRCYPAIIYSNQTLFDGRTRSIRGFQKGLKINNTKLCL